ncbi:MAG: hypothetical protein HMLKMBBP_03603 [Planctomycetes bacterium]|nr:hypothetical protein [Planctomycetota bacterium]
MSDVTGPRPAESDPIFSLRWSWWRRPASMRWVGDGFEGHMATAIWTWIASRPVAAGIALMAAAAAMLGGGIAPYLALSCVVVGARALSERWPRWRVIAVSVPFAGVTEWMNPTFLSYGYEEYSLVVVYAAAVGTMARRPLDAVFIASLLPAVLVSVSVSRYVIHPGCVLAAAPLFCLASTTPRVAGLAIAALFGGAIIVRAMDDMGTLVQGVSQLILLFPATAILRAANEPYSGADPTTRWVAAAHRRPWMAAAAWIGISLAAAICAHSAVVHPGLAAVSFAASTWTGSHLVAGSRSVVARFAALVISGPAGGVLAVTLASQTVLTVDPYVAVASIAVAATLGALAGMLRLTVPGSTTWHCIVPSAVACAFVAWVGLRSAPRWDYAEWVRSAGRGFEHQAIASGALAGAWIGICVTLALAARSRTTVPDDHPIHQLRELRERRARGEA